MGGMALELDDTLKCGATRNPNGSSRSGEGI